MNVPSTVPTRSDPRLRPDAGAHRREAPSETAQFGRVRGVVWGALALAILVAMAIPAGLYVQEATSAPSAHACLWPATPRANAPARLVIVLAAGRDSADAQTPQAQAQAQWDMLTMRMGAERAIASGSDANGGAFIVPLALSMAGPWQAQVSLREPGRPSWSERIDFTALATGASAAAPAVPSSARLLLACQAKGATT